MSGEASSTYAIPDEEIVRQVQEGSEEGAQVLIDRYTPLIQKMARRYFAAGADYEDLLQEGFIGFYEAVRDFQPGKMAFNKFAYYCVQKNIFDTVQYWNRKKRRSDQPVLSLDAALYPDEDKSERVRVIDHIVNQKAMNPEDSVVIASLVAEIVTLLTPLERDVLRCYLNGDRPDGIAKELSRDLKSVDNALQRAKSKIRDYLLAEIKGEKPVDG